MNGVSALFFATFAAFCNKVVKEGPKKTRYKPVDKLVVCIIMASMKTIKPIQIGAFDAKTHFSELLQDVIKGKTFEILRRGKPVAHLTSIRAADNSGVARAALDYFRDLRRTISVSRAEARSWINEGRS